MAFLTSLLANQIVLYAGGSILGIFIAWLLKKIPNDKFNKAVEKFFHWLGKWITLSISKRSKLWNKIVEPWVIDLIDNVVCAALRGFIAGLRSDDS